MDPELWIEDTTAKAISFFLVEREIPMAITRGLIEELKEISKQRGSNNARLCLHRGPDADMQDMVIIEYQDKTCRKPHKHPRTKETMQVIDGEMMSFVFDNYGNLTGKTLLANNNLIYIVPSGISHLYLPVTDYVVYREIKPGSFNRNIDNVYWSSGHIEFLKKNADFLKDLRCNNPNCNNRCPLGSRTGRALKGCLI